MRVPVLENNAEASLGLETPSKEGSRGSEERDRDIVGWEGPDDPADPFNWPNGRKWLITCFGCFITFIVGIQGTAMTAAVEPMNEYFGVSDAKFANSYWPITAWTVAAGFVPLAGLPLMETFGVRPGYMLSYIIFFVFIIPQAVAQNYATLIVTRVFSGGFAGILENIIGGIISDIWRGERARSIPVAMYIWAYEAGITIGPAIGGVIVQHLNWRWIFYIQLIIYGSFFPVAYLIIPETRSTVILQRKARQIRAATGKPVYAQSELDHPGMKALIWEAVGRPVYMLCTEYVVFSFTLWSAFCFGNALLFTQSVAQVYTELYDFTAPQTGYVQLALVIGVTIGFFMQLPANNWYYKSAARNTEEPGRYIPEARLYLAIPGSFVGLAGGFFIYAWTSYGFVHWMGPTIGLGLVGIGIFIVVNAVSNYVEDAYEKYAASVLGAVAFGENMFAGFLPLAEMSMYTNLDFRWASTLLAFLALLLSFAPVVLIFYGKSIRDRSPFIREARHEHRG